MKTFAALIRNEAKAGGDNNARFSQVIYVDSDTPEQAYAEIDNYARKNQYVVEKLHDGAFVYEAKQIQLALPRFSSLSGGIEALGGGKKGSDPLAGFFPKE